MEYHSRPVLQNGLLKGGCFHPRLDFKLLIQLSKCFVFACSPILPLLALSHKVFQCLTPPVSLSSIGCVSLEKLAGAAPPLFAKFTACSWPSQAPPSQQSASTAVAQPGKQQRASQQLELLAVAEELGFLDCFRALAGVVVVQEVSTEARRLCQALLSSSSCHMRCTSRTV